MDHPYRSSDREPGGATSATGELVYLTREPSRNSGTTRSAVQTLAAGGILAAGVSVSGYGSAALGILGLAVGLAIYRWRSAAEVAGVRFFVERGALDVRVRGARTPLVVASLEDVLAVELDTRTVEKVEANTSGVPGLRYIDATVSPAVDVSRIAIVVRGRPLPIPLTDEYVSHMDSIEWLGKIRTFLRKRDWVPLDEREDAPASEDLDD